MQLQQLMNRALMLAVGAADEASARRDGDRQPGRDGQELLDHTSRPAVAATTGEQRVLGRQGAAAATADVQQGHLGHIAWPGQGYLGHSLAGSRLLSANAETVLISL